MVTISNSCRQQVSYPRWAFSPRATIVVLLKKMELILRKRGNANAVWDTFSSCLNPAPFQLVYIIFTYAKDWGQNSLSGVFAFYDGQDQDSVNSMGSL
jgi:hypothetical protein